MKTNQITKIFVYIFLLLLLCFTSDMQNEWVFVHWGKTISNISNYLNENGDVNTLLSLATIFIMFYFSYINLTDYSKKYFGLYIVIVLDCILLFSTKYWVWNRTLFGIKWWLLLLLSITVPVVVSLIFSKKSKGRFIKWSEQGIRNIQSKAKGIINKNYEKSNIDSIEEDDISGFCIDNVEENTTDPHIRQPYADLIIKKVLATKQKDSLAIGISGDWGSGKTLFLKHIENSIVQQQKNNSNILIVNFCPWESSDSRQIIVDFFNTLCEKVAPHYSAVKKPILKYAELLTMVDAPNWLVSVSEILEKKKHPTISKLKERISVLLSELGGRIFVLIDDIDRLNEQEIYETFKLIRNTADFANVVYIVSYDKGYVCEQLTALGIKSSNLYIEKIFPIELKLQSPEPHFQSRCLVESFQLMTKDEIIKESAVSVIKYYNDIISNILNTYRQVKRFARQLALNVEALKENRLYNEISFEDFFLLELLYYHNADLYNTLRSNPTKILVAKKDSKYNINIFTLRAGFDGAPVNPAELFPYKGVPVDEQSAVILKQIFIKHTKYRKVTQLAYTESYHKYFSFGISFDQISQTELYGFVNGTKNIDPQIEEWCMNHKHNSLYRLLISYNLNDDIYVCKRYITMVLSFVAHYPLINMEVGKFLSATLRAKKYDEKNIQELQQFTISELKRFIYGFTHIQEYVLFSKGLARIFRDEYEESQRTGNEGYSLVGSCDNAKSLIIENVETFLSKNPNSADNLFDDTCAINALVKASAISLDTDGAEDYHMSVLFDTLLRYFSVHKGHNKHRAEMYFEVNISDSPSEEELEDRQLESNRLLDQMFTKPENYIKILKECFDAGTDKVMS